MTYVDKIYKGGFNFENAQRNNSLISDEAIKKHFTKTGTTIVGLQFNGGVILAADTRATSHHVAEKNCNKIHFISKNMTCCGAGTAADCEYVTSQLIRENSSAIGAHASKHRTPTNGLHFCSQSHTGTL